MWAVFLSVLTSFFWWALPRVFIALGLYTVSDSLSTQVFSFLQSQINAQVSSIPAQFLNAVYLTGLLQAVTLILSASVFAVAIKAAKGAVSAAGSAGTGSGGAS